MRIPRRVTVICIGALGGALAVGGVSAANAFETPKLPSPSCSPTPAMSARENVPMRKYPTKSDAQAPASDVATPAPGETEAVPMRSYPVKPGDYPLGNVATGSPVRTPAPGETEAVPMRSHPVTPDAELPDCR